MGFDDRFRLLLAEFGAAQGIPELVPDDEGFCALAVDDLALNLQFNPHNGEATLFSPLGSIPPAHRDLIGRHLLGANLLWQGTAGATLGADIESGDIVMANRFSIQGLNGREFAARLEAFVNQAVAWRRYIEELEGRLDEVSEEQDSPVPPGQRRYLVRG